MSISMVTGGSFTSDGNTRIISLPGGANNFRTFNITQASTTQTPGRGFQFEWWLDQTAQDKGMEWLKTDATNDVKMVALASGGFSYFTSAPSPSAPLTGTTITAANPAVATVNNTYSNGDRVRIYNSTGMLQISTMEFTISSVSSTQFTLLGLDSSGYAAGATAFSVVKIAPYQQVLPEYMFITSITAANPMVVKLSTECDKVYAVGMKVRLDIPSTYGMQQANGLEGTITAIGAYTLTLDIDSSGFSAFAFPTSSAAGSQSRFATIAPAGQKAYYDFSTNTQYGYNVTQAPFHNSQIYPYMSLAAGAHSPAGSNGDVIEWVAVRYE